MGRGSEQTVLQRRNSGGQKAHEKMLHITNHQGNANSNHYEIVHHTSQDDQHPKGKQQHMLARTQRKGNPPTCW